MATDGGSRPDPVPPGPAQAPAGEGDRGVGPGRNHKGPVVRAFLKRNRRLRLEMLPPYALELNPVEQVWGWLKYGQLANLVPDGLADLDVEVIERLVELKCDPGLLRNLWEASDLPFPRKRRVKQVSQPASQ